MFGDVGNLPIEIMNFEKHGQSMGKNKHKAKTNENYETIVAKFGSFCSETTFMYSLSPLYT